MHLHCIILNGLSVELFIDYKLLNQICNSTFELGVNPDNLFLKLLAVWNYSINEFMVIFCEGTKFIPSIV